LKSHEHAIKIPLKSHEHCIEIPFNQNFAGNFYPTNPATENMEPLPSPSGLPWGETVSGPRALTSSLGNDVCLGAIGLGLLGGAPL